MTAGNTSIAGGGGAPVINVEPCEPEIVVQVESATPDIFVESATPDINVEPAVPDIHVEPEITVEVQPQVEIDLSDVVAKLGAIADSIALLASMPFEIKVECCCDDDDDDDKDCRERPPRPPRPPKPPGKKPGPPKRKRK